MRFFNWVFGELICDIMSVAKLTGLLNAKINRNRLFFIVGSCVGDVLYVQGISSFGIRGNVAEIDGKAVNQCVFPSIYKD